MPASKVDIKADIEAAVDRGEPISQMEPLILAEGTPHRAELADLAVELVRKAVGFRRSLPEPLLSSLATLVRSMNCYYSNLIEGHNTHPVDIERALNDDYSIDPKRRDLQREAKAHIVVQYWIDTGGLTGRAVTQDGICEVHRRFCELLPEDLLWIEDPTTHERMQVVPGELRRRDVAVGGHVAISPGAVPRFLTRFAEVYGRQGLLETILAVAAAHHRLLWIHPFLDGNGRVARLVSHAMLLETLDTGGVWSVARGLARREQAYKAHLAACDMPRRNGLDGRGSLSEESLLAFTRFVLEVCLDQVDFMEGLMETTRFRTRLLQWADEEIRLGVLPRQAGAVLEALLYRGELPLADVAGIVGAGERQGRRVISALKDTGILPPLTSRRWGLRLALPATLAARLMPGLFPEQTA